MVAGDDGGPADEPVTMMDYNASITYTHAGHRQRRPRRAGHRRGPASSACSARSCGRIYTGGRGYCPVDAIELGPEHEVDLPQTGTITNYTIITPVQYPGQTETEPFARVYVLLDGTDVVLGYQPLLELAERRRAHRHAGRRRCGRRRPRRRQDLASSAEGSLLGWMPTGEPDVDDPDLVNRIF